MGPVLLLSHLEKACLSGSSPGSTQRCRAAEKCPQATAISAKDITRQHTVTFNLNEISSVMWRNINKLHIQLKMLMVESENANYNCEIQLMNTGEHFSYFAQFASHPGTSARKQKQHSVCLVVWGGKKPNRWWTHLRRILGTASYYEVLIALSLKEPVHILWTQVMTGLKVIYRCRRCLCSEHSLCHLPYGFLSSSPPQLDWAGWKCFSSLFVYLGATNEDMIIFLRVSYCLIVNKQ